MNKPSMKEKAVFLLALIVALIILIVVGYRAFYGRASVSVVNHATQDQSKLSGNGTAEKTVLYKNDVIVPGESPFAEFKPKTDLPVKVTEKFTQPPIVAVEEIPREKPADSTLRNKRDGRQDNPLIIKAIIGKNTAIITDGRRVETVRTGEKSSWGLVGAIMPAGMYIGDKFVASSYETGTTQGSDSSSSPRDSPYSYNWPDDH